MEVEIQAEEIQKLFHRQRSPLPWVTVRLKYCELLSLPGT